VTVSAHVEAQTQQYQILVGDTGCGIPAAELEQVFEPLYTRKPWGIGLGLSLCKELIAHHGGRITLHSRVGHGTTVHILMPAPSWLMTCTTLVEERHDGLNARDPDRG
ncbi:MAG: ATP-binding protein, partial [Candidatus Tectomicrobia bacterium]